MACLKTIKGRALQGRGKREKKVPSARTFVILPIPTDVLPTLGLPATVRNQAYYVSTGTSTRSGGEFPGVIFPFQGKSEDSGWIIKQRSVGNEPWRLEFCRLVDSFHPPIQVVPGHEYVSCALRYHNFLSKFRHWFQLQQSAAFGADFWTRPDLAYLRALALHFNWDGTTNRFAPSDDIAPQYTMRPNKCKTLKRHESWFTENNIALAQELNDLLRNHHALISRLPPTEP